MPVLVRCSNVGDQYQGIAMPPAFILEWIIVTYDLMRAGPHGDAIALLNDDGRWQFTEHVGPIVGEQFIGATFNQFRVDEYV